MNCFTVLSESINCSLECFLLVKLPLNGGSFFFKFPLVGVNLVLALSLQEVSQLSPPTFPNIEVNLLSKWQSESSMKKCVFQLLLMATKHRTNSTNWKSPPGN